MKMGGGNESFHYILNKISESHSNILVFFKKNRINWAVSNGCITSNKKITTARLGRLPSLEGCEALLDLFNKSINFMVCNCEWFYLSIDWKLKRELTIAPLGLLTYGWLLPGLPTWDDGLWPLVCPSEVMVSLHFNLSLDLPMVRDKRKGQL
jgi:hypothetical protein